MALLMLGSVHAVCGHCRLPALLRQPIEDPPPPLWAFPRCCLKLDITPHAWCCPCCLILVTSLRFALNLLRTPRMLAEKLPCMCCHLQVEIPTLHQTLAAVDEQQYQQLQVWTVRQSDA